MALDELTRGERTRLTILEAAQELFLQNGSLAHYLNIYRFHRIERPGFNQKDYP